MQEENSKTKFVFFGTNAFAVAVLEELKKHNFLPTLIITTEDKPKGRKLVLTPPETKVWAEKNSISYIQPNTLKTEEVVEKIKSYNVDFFVVASYGKIIPQIVLDIPQYGTLNVHPSLLPKLRGASPIESAILLENETGVTIMKLDAQMDHGPIVSQKKILEWEGNNPPHADDLEKTLAHEGGKLLAEIIPEWISGKVSEVEQDHTKATFCKKIEKSDGEINLSDDAEKNIRKIRAYHIWPTAYFFDDGKRIIVKQAHIEDAKLILDRIIPEGKKEMSYTDFLKGQK
jgi:methionyl-tRNA formyltransferase